jgi:hypothetical protein
MGRARAGRDYGTRSVLLAPLRHCGSTSQATLLLVQDGLWRGFGLRAAWNASNIGAIRAAEGILSPRWLFCFWRGVGRWARFWWL